LLQNQVLFACAEQTLAQRRQVLLVVWAADFQFQNWVSLGVGDFFADDFRTINADAEGGHVAVLGEAEVQKIEDSLVGSSGGAVK
jgi:hypothetical protein